jgi:hypothetical protein
VVALIDNVSRLFSALNAGRDRRFLDVAIMELLGVGMHVRASRQSTTEIVSRVLIASFIVLIIMTFQNVPVAVSTSTSDIEMFDGRTVVSESTA